MTNEVVDEPIALDESALLARVCKASFYRFVQEFWGEIIKETPVWNWHIPYLCSELQRIAARVMAGQPNTKDALINVPPGTTKSTLVSEMFPPWVWTRWPEAQFLCGSYAHMLGLDLARKSRDIVLSAKYQQAFKLGLRDDQSAKGYFMNDKGGWRLSCTPTSTATGFHAHFILVDDPLNPNEALSEAKLKEANEWMRQTLPSRKVNKATACTILIMQRLHQSDPSQQMLDRGKLEGGTQVQHICLPAVLSDQVKPLKVRANYTTEGLLDPIRLSPAVLASQKVALGEYGFAGQYGQNPVPSEGGMFKVERIRADTLPKRWKKRVRYWDKAGTQDGGCFTAGVEMGEDELDRIWVIDVVRGQWESAAREATMRLTAQADGLLVLQAVEQEPGSGGLESAQNTLRKTFKGFRGKAVRPTGDKVLRADTFSTQVNACNVFVPEGAPWVSSYLEELRFFPLGTYKDQVDASSGAYGELNNFKPRAGALGGQA